MTNVAIADVEESVKVGESKEQEVLNLFLNYLKKNYPKINFTATPFPKLSALDYIIIGDDRIICFLEIKVRTKKFKDTIVPMTKEMVALFDFNYHKISTWLLIFTQEDESLRCFDMSQPSTKRKPITRHDRNVTSYHSFFEKATTIE